MCGAKKTMTMVSGLQWNSLRSYEVLGIENLMHKNFSLLFQWCWLFSQEDDSLWKRIVASIQCTKGVMASKMSFVVLSLGYRHNCLEPMRGFYS